MSYTILHKHTKINKRQGYIKFGTYRTKENALKASKKLVGSNYMIVLRSRVVKSNIHKDLYYLR